MNHPNGPRAIWVHPGVYHGEPCVGGTRMPIDILAEAHWNGTSVHDICDNWVVDRDEILLSCWYMARHSKQVRWAIRWRDWLVVADEAMWHSGSWDHIDMPPQKS